MFYTKTINIYVDPQPSVDEYGIVRKGELELVDTLYTDVQPIDRLRSQKNMALMLIYHGVSFHHLTNTL